MRSLEGLSELDDGELALRAGRGDRDAFEALIARWWKRLSRLCAAACAYDAVAADELASDVLVRIYLALPRFRGDASFGSFAWRICRNAATDAWRRRGRERRQRARFHGLVDPQAGPEENFLRIEELSSLKAAMLRLAPADRALVHLAETEGLGGAELARIFEVAPGTIKSRLFRIRRKLAVYIGEVDRDK
jgi:RNA polymerase sigma-70 factor (ECF subfamily)